MEPYFLYTRNVDSECPIMLINTHIGMDEVDGMGVDANQFVNELLALDGMGKKCIDIWINSVGGGVMDGMSIYNAMLRTKTKVDTYNVGVAASTAGWLFQAGRTRTMSDYALFMAHETSGGENNEVLNKFNNSVATMISSRCGKSMEDVLDMMSKTTWMTASEALMNGYCDAVENSSASNKKRVSASNNIKDNWKICADIVNSALQNTTTVKNQINMSSFAVIANSLGLNPEASAEAIAKAIQDYKNKADLATANMAAKDAEIEKLTNSMAFNNKAHKEALEAKDAEIEDAKNKGIADVDAIKNQFKEKEDLLEKLTKEQEEATAKALKDNATTMVMNHVKLGRIENKVEIVGEWVALAIKNGMEETEKLLNAIPLNKKAVKIEIENKDNVVTTSTHSLALKNRMARQN